MSEEIINTLRRCRLCQDLTEDMIQKMLLDVKSSVKSYEKGEFIFHEEDCPKKIYILISGRVAITKETLAGRRILLMNIDTPADMFGEVYLFLERSQYDMQAEALEKSVVLSLSDALFASYGDVDSELSQKLLYNLMCIFAKKAFLMNGKLRVLGSSSIREKIVRFLFERQDNAGMILGNLAREEMADYMNVTRPSLSRELGKMQEEGILVIEGRNIEILDQERFESYL